MGNICLWEKKCNKYWMESTKSTLSSQTFYDSQYLPFFIFLHIIGNIFCIFVHSEFIFTLTTHISQECLHGFYERLKELLCNHKDSFFSCSTWHGCTRKSFSHVTYIHFMGKCDVEQSFKPLHHWIILYGNDSKMMEALNCF